MNHNRRRLRNLKCVHLRHIEVGLSSTTTTTSNSNSSDNNKSPCSNNNNNNSSSSRTSLSKNNNYQQPLLYSSLILSIQVSNNNNNNHNHNNNDHNNNNSSSSSSGDDGYHDNDDDQGYLYSCSAEYDIDSTINATFVIQLSSTTTASSSSSSSSNVASSTIQKKMNQQQQTITDDDEKESAVSQQQQQQHDRDDYFESTATKQYEQSTQYDSLLKARTFHLKIQKEYTVPTNATMKNNTINMKNSVYNKSSSSSSSSSLDSSINSLIGVDSQDKKSDEIDDNIVQTSVDFYQPIVQMTCDLSDVVFVGPNMMNMVAQRFPLNCVFLEFADGIFITRETAHQMLIGYSALSSNELTPAQSPSVHLKPIPNLDNVHHFITLNQLENMIGRLVGIQYGINAEQESSLALKQTIEQTIQQRERIRLLKQQIQNKKNRIEKLQCVHEQSFLAIQKKRKHQLVKSQYIMNHLDQLTSSCHSLNQYSATLMQHENAKIPKLRSQLDIIVNRCERRQRQIASLVAQCFEVTRDKTGKYWTINGLSIYKNDQLSTDDEAASALGFVCQCIRILSKLYQIPLKFQVFPMASRSFVRDDDINDQKLLLPLFIMRASEKPKYYQAVFLLNVNICHILKVRGVQTTMAKRFDVLESLEVLLHHAKN